MPLCNFGCGQEATHQFKNGKFCCSSTVNKCSAKRARDSQIKKGKHLWEGKEHPRGATGIIPYNKGKTYDEIFGIERSAQIRSKLRNGPDKKEQWESYSAESRTKHADKARSNIQARYDKGWMPKAGRCKKIEYCSTIAGIVFLDGSWELLAAKYLDLIGVRWQRNTKRFPYINLEDKISYYTPDFYVEDWQKYLEIKGYETKLDICKWSQFNHPLIIWRQADIKLIDKLLKTYESRGEICSSPF
jgi:hypothetical protein